MKSKVDLLGFNDKWLMIIGIPFVSLIISSVLFANALANNSNYFFSKCYPTSLYYTTVFWFVFRTIIIQVRKHETLANDSVKRIIVEVVLVLIAFFLLKPVFHQLIILINPIEDNLYEPHAIIDIFSSLLFSFFIMAIYEIIYIHRQLTKSNLEREQLGRAHLESQLEGLKSQIQPHFLFNSLNTLAGLIPIDEERAVKYVQKLSQVFRYVLEIENQPLIRLEKELEFLDAYVHLLKERFGDNIQISMKIPSSHHHELIVPLSLQILFENAVKHNVLTRDNPLHISIYIDQGHRITVKNNLRPKAEPESSTGIGLENIEKRYKFFIEDPIEVIANLESFVVSLPLIPRTALVK